MLLVTLLMLAQAPEVSATELEPESAASERTFGLHAGVHAALAVIDVTSAPLYGFASAALGLALLSDGAWSVTTVGFGWTSGLGAPAESMWMFDVFALATAGKIRQGFPSTSDPIGAVGGGIGFRFLHHSGFTLGFKLPLAGVAIAPFVRRGEDAVGWFFLMNLTSMPLVSLGWRF